MSLPMARHGEHQIRKIILHNSFLMLIKNSVVILVRGEMAESVEHLKIYLCPAIGG